MNRRHFVKRLPAATAMGTAFLHTPTPITRDDERTTTVSGNDDRRYWVNTLTKIADPVLSGLAQNTLKATMPVEVGPGANARNRAQYTHLEALGRLMAGMAPWLELGPDSSPEGRVRKKYIDLSLRAITNGVDPHAKDFLNFDQAGAQSLVDAAFLAQGLLRAPRQLYANLGSVTQQHVITALQATRKFPPPPTNWVLFSAMIEAALLHFTGTYEAAAIDFALARMREWYKGDGVYGDGSSFHWDYYNSYVIQPMLMDVCAVLTAKGLGGSPEYVTERAQRYAIIQERFISPEGTYPLIGRSSTYRIGAFQTLAQIALQKKLPAPLVPAQVRCALTSVMKRSLGAKGTFDDNGWLQIGFCGHQPQLAEPYISTGSLYLTSLAFLPLGLPVTDEFWTSPAADWTSRQVYSGKDLDRDEAID